MEYLLSINIWINLLTLVFIEIVLGIDNVIFISIIANKSAVHQQKKVVNIGLVLAMIQRIFFLFFISQLILISRPFFSFDIYFLSAEISIRGLILFLGGLFLLYKSITEIYQKVEHKEGHIISSKIKKRVSLGYALFQIILIDFVFSIDSVLTAVGMTFDIEAPRSLVFGIMASAVIISILLTMLYANAIRQFIAAHASIQILGLTFLILISLMLIAEAGYISKLLFFGNGVSKIPKGYLYFTISFSLLVEFINIKMRKNEVKKKIN